MKKPLAAVESEQIIKSGMADAKARFVTTEVLPAPAKLAINANLPSLKTANDKAVAKKLNKLFVDAHTGMRRIIALGLFAWQVKEQQLKHGEFGAWLDAHCPDLTTVDAQTGKPVASRALRGYMDLTRSVLESIGFSTLEKYFQEIGKLTNTKNCDGGGYLLLTDKQVPDQFKPLREKICTLVDGKTQKSLFTEFKQAEEVSEGQTKKKVGRSKGCPGTTAEQRATVAQAEAEAVIEADKLRMEEFAAWLTEFSEEPRIGPHRGTAHGFSLLKALAFFRSMYLSDATES